MRTARFDWRWLWVILFVAILANSRALPWPIPAFTLGIAGGYLLYMAWEALKGTGLPNRGKARVTYWRGERVELQRPAPRLRPGDLTALTPTVIYGLIGLALILAAVALAMRRLGI